MYHVFVHSSVVVLCSHPAVPLTYLFTVQGVQVITVFGWTKCEILNFLNQILEFKTNIDSYQNFPILLVLKTRCPIFFF